MESSSTVRMNNQVEEDCSAQIRMPEEERHEIINGLRALPIELQVVALSTLPDTLGLYRFTQSISSHTRYHLPLMKEIKNRMKILMSDHYIGDDETIQLLDLIVKGDVSITQCQIEESGVSYSEFKVHGVRLTGENGTMLIVSDGISQKTTLMSLEAFISEYTSKTSFFESKGESLFTQELCDE